MSLNNFKALLKKNLLILKSTYILTFIELFSPMMVMLILLLINSKFETEHYELTEKNYYKNCSSFSANIYSFCRYIDSITYCPPNSTIALIGENFPNEIKERIRARFKKRKYLLLDFINYESFNELKNYIKSKTYKKSRQVCFGISYKKDVNKYTFKLHYFASQYIKDRRHANIPSSNVDILDPFRVKPDFDSFYLYMRTGYLMTQKILYDYVLRKETGIYDASIRFNIIPQKYDEKLYNLLHQFLSEIISIIVLIAYAFPLCINIYRLVKEKESKAKEIMKIIGLNEFSYFLSYFIIYFVMNIFYALLNSIIMNQVLNYVEMKYLFLYFFLYGIVIYSLIFFFQSFLEKAKLSIIFCLLVYIIVYFIGYPLRSRSVNKTIKIIFGLLFPPINLDLGSNTLTQFQINFNQFNGRVFMEYKNYSIFDMYILFLFNFIIYIFLGFYLQNVLPHEYGIHKPWNFLCKKKYWDLGQIFFINKKKNISKNNKVNKDNIHFHNINTSFDTIIEEKDKKISMNLNTKKIGEIKNSDNIKPKIKKDEKDILHIRNIKKQFGDKKVLNGVNFDLCKNEIFVLLGHNGAGKTTLISILTGLITSNSGEVIYNNKNILSPENVSILHKKIGICPQHNVLFEDLTVEEHLELFCEFKSESQDNKNQEISSILNTISLMDKRKTKAGDLSGGQKRKLSVGIALIGKSSLIFLDEPTSGMDITSRRNLWDMLKLCSNGKYIILTTHFMEEAAVLGNRIGILSEGEMKVIGTPLELIEKYAQNVNLNITKHFDSNEDIIISYILDNFNNKNLNIDIENFNREILFRISAENQEIKWSEFFEKLDKDKSKLKIKSYSISKSTLEDVFINLGKYINKNKNNMNNSKENYESQRLKKSKELKHNSSLYITDNNYDTNINNFSKFWKDFKMCFMKRMKQIIRDQKTFSLEILCPILLTFIGCLVGYIELLEENKSFPLTLNQITNDSQIIYYKNYLENYNSNFLVDFNNYILNHKFSENISKIKFENINGIDDYNYNLNIINNTYELYEQKKLNKNKSYIYYVPIDINLIKQKYIFNIVVDITVRHISPISVSFLLNNVIRIVTNKDIQIEMINEPFPYTDEEIKDKKSRNQILIVFFISVAFSLIPSNFITVLIKERENNSKHLQIISGISLFGYWFNNYIFDLIKYYLIGGICFFLLIIFDFYEKYFHILYLEYGPAMISFTYLFTSTFKSEYKGQITVLLINLIFGTIFGIAVIIMRTYYKLYDYANKLAYAFRIVPSFCFCYGYNQLIKKNVIFKLDKNVYKENTEKNVNDTIISIDHVGADCVYLIVEFIFYLIILIILENHFEKNFYRRKIDLNDDIFKEEDDVNLESSRSEHSDYAIKVKNLVKIYYDNCFNKINAVKNISFNLVKGEIFGFLGTNGAGKTTTFKCLSHEIYPTFGNIEINGLDIIPNFNKIRNLIGYCPQFDAIFDYLTVYENLEFYGKIKGAKEEKLNSIIKALIEEMNLVEFENKISGTLSGGNKRKLTVAIALICNPPIILLDEPSTGMDPEARRHMWKVIYNVSLNKKESTIIMTTHSMEEAESLCKKIGILVDGKFKCLGTSDEIKIKYGKGFEFNLQIKEPEIHELYLKYKINQDNFNLEINKIDFDECFRKYNLEKYKIIFNKGSFGEKVLEELNNKRFISLNKIILTIYYSTYSLGIIKLIKNYFDNIICVDFKENNFLFQIERKKSEEEKSIGFLFGLIEDYKNEYNVGQYSLQYSPLEQIFNEFAIKKENKQQKINIVINKDILDIFC